MKNIAISVLISALLGISIYTMEMTSNSTEEAKAEVVVKPKSKPVVKPNINLPKKYQNLHAMISKTFPGLEIQEFKKSGVTGIVEFNLGAQVLYASEDGHFLIKGDIYDLATQENLTDKSEQIGRVSTLERIGEENMLVYKAKDEKHFITVFTDVDCPYCRVLHDEVQQYLSKGISVRYLFLPFKGKKSFDKSVSVWCSKNPQEALNNAKKGRRIRSSTCEHPIDMHMALGQEFGVRGTPAIVLDDGLMIPGYRPVKDVAKVLDGVAK